MQKLPNNVSISTFADAKSLITNLNNGSGWCGFHDWRLPTLSAYNTLFSGLVGATGYGVDETNDTSLLEILQNLGFKDYRWGFVWSDTKYDTNNNYRFSLALGDTAFGNVNTDRNQYLMVRGGI
jgi:hypothetical protein